MSEKIPVSFLMITLNEEYNLPGALDCIKDLTDEVFIVDSLSTDKTIDIALEHNAKVVQRRFTNFGDHWGWTIKNMPVSNPWVFVLAPDERISDPLKEELRRLFRDGPKEDAYTVKWRLWFMGKPLHVAVDNPRLFKHDKLRVSDNVVNEHFITSGTTGNLKGILEHLDSRDLNDWLAKQNRYTTMEAITHCSNADFAETPKLFGNKLQRRMFLKKNFRKIPFRYQLMFLQLFFLHGAWKSGQAGLDWVHARIMARRLVEMKIREIKTINAIPEIPKAPSGQFDPRVVNSELQTKVHPNFDS